jgi:hypothetical protein
MNVDDISSRSLVVTIATRLAMRTWEARYLRETGLPVIALAGAVRSHHQLGQEAGKLSWSVSRDAPTLGSKLICQGLIG